jgi:hypothetical protein
MKINGTNLPTTKESEELILWAHEKNPGPWLNHSKVVARSAKIIAEKSNLDGNIAYILGILHDIGRYRGITGLRHIYDGYNLMNNKGYGFIAKICITHSFPYKDLESFNGENDCTDDETQKIKMELEKYEYDDYDKLIQLCDSISLAEGICLLEVRLVDVVRRYGKFNKSILNKWNAFFEIKEYFDNKCGINIYELFKEEIIKNSIK